MMHNLWLEHKLQINCKTKYNVKVRPDIDRNMQLEYCSLGFLHTLSTDIA